MPRKPVKGIQRRLFKTGGRNKARHTLLFRAIKSKYFENIGPAIRKELERLPMEIIDSEFMVTRRPLVLGHLSNIMTTVINEKIIAKMNIEAHQKKTLSELARKHIGLMHMHPEKMYAKVFGIPHKIHLPTVRKNIKEAFEILEKASLGKQAEFGSIKAREHFQKTWTKILRESNEDAVVDYTKKDIVMLQNVVDLKIEELLGRKQAVDFITELEWVEDILSNELKELIKERMEMHGSDE